MAVVWRVVARSPALVALATDHATLLIEAQRVVASDPELRDAIARLAPHLSFGPATSRPDVVERIATSGDDRVLVGRRTRGIWSVAYLLSSREPIDIDEVVAGYLVATVSPFDHLVD